jgi:hypothetical protein
MVCVHVTLKSHFVPPMHPLLISACQGQDFPYTSHHVTDQATPKSRGEYVARLLQQCARSTPGQK